MRLSQYVLTNSAAKVPPYHMTAEHVERPLQGVVVDRILGHQPVQDREGEIAVMYQTHYNVIMLIINWGKEVQLRHLCSETLMY